MKCTGAFIPLDVLLKSYPELSLKRINSRGQEKSEYHIGKVIWTFYLVRVQQVDFNADDVRVYIYIYISLEPNL